MRPSQLNKPLLIAVSCIFVCASKGKMRYRTNPSTPVEDFDCSTGVEVFYCLTRIVVFDFTTPIEKFGSTTTLEDFDCSTRIKDFDYDQGRLRSCDWRIVKNTAILASCLRN